MGTHPTVSVVVTVLNSRETLEECIQSLLDQDYPRDRYEVVVVDGGSRDGTSDILGRYPIRLIHAPGTTIGAGRNRGIQASSGEIVAITDGDMVTDRVWLRELVAPFDDPTVGAVGGPNLTNPRAPRFAQLVGLLPEECPSFKELREVEHLLVYTRNAAYRREAILRAQHFNEVARAGEDPELNWKIKQLGYRLLFNPRARGWHYHRTNLRKFLRQHWRNGYGVGQLAKVSPKAFHTAKHLAASGALIAGLATIPLAVATVDYRIAAVPLGILAAFLASCLGNGFRAFRRTHRLHHIPPVTILTMIWVPVWLFGYLKGRTRSAARLKGRPTLMATGPAGGNGRG